MTAATTPATDAEIERYERYFSGEHDPKDGDVILNIPALIARIHQEREDAAIGRSIISAIGHEVSDTTSPLYGWSPAEHYDEVITDLVEMVHESREREKAGWQPIETAPKDGTHCILAVKEGPFIWAVQGVFHKGQWDAVHRENVDPLCWMKNVLIPDEFLPWKQCPTPPALSQEERT